MDSIYAEARQELEKRLKVLNPKQIDLELKVYDTMIKSMRERYKQLEAEIQETYGQEFGEYDRIANNIEEIIVQLSGDHPGASLPELFDRMRKTQDYEADKKGFIDTRLSRAEHYSRKYGHLPAFIAILNYEPERHEDGIIKANERHSAVGKTFYSNEAWDEVNKLAYEDGAFLLNSKGKILAVHAEIDYHPAIAKGHPKDKDEVNLQLGFRGHVGLRHPASSFASKNMPGTIVYVLGEEAQQIRRLESGINTASTRQGEAADFTKVLEELGRPHLSQHI